MILETKEDKIEIHSEDAVDAEFMRSLFAGPIDIKYSYDRVREGFHFTGEKICQVTITKKDES